MITWMQKHKKYLVVTIWVSTIAFVGAGFVGWGAYDFNKSRATSVAKVGDMDIPVSKYQTAYSNIHAFYSQAVGRNLSEEEANNMGLGEMAFETLIQESLFLNYAKDLGLSVNNDEVIAELLKTPSFQTNGKFDVGQYESVLKSLRTNPTNYEAQIKERLLLNKLFSALDLGADENSVSLLGADMFMSDEIKAKLIKAPSINISEDELKASWEKSKDLYLSEQKYELGMYFVPVAQMEVNDNELRAFYEENRGDYRDGEDKILDFDSAKVAVASDFALKNTKRTALEEYVKIKKGEKNAEEKLSLSASDNKGIDFAVFKDIKAGDVLKPVEYNGGFAIFKVENIIAPAPKSFEEARSEVNAALLAKKQKDSLEALAKEALANKASFDLSAKISKNDDATSLGLSDDESSELIAKIFASKTKDGYTIFKDKAVVYEIVSQNLLDKEKLGIFSSALEGEAAKLKNSEINQALLTSLAKRYKIERYYK